MTAVSLAKLYEEWVNAPDERTFEKRIRTHIIKAARREGASLAVLKVLLTPVRAERRKP